MPELSLALAQVLSMDPTPGPLLVNGRAPATNHDGPFHIPIRPVSACAHCGGVVRCYQDLRPVSWSHAEGCEAWAQEQAFARSKQQLHEAAAALREDWLSMFSTLVECCEPPPYPPNPDLQALPWVQTPTGWERQGVDGRLLVVVTGDAVTGAWTTCTGETHGKGKGKAGADLYLYGQGFTFAEGGNPMGAGARERREPPPVRSPGDSGLEPAFSAYQGAHAMERTVHVNGTTWIYHSDGPLVYDHGQEWATIHVDATPKGTRIRLNTHRDDTRWGAMSTEAFVAEIRAMLQAAALDVL